MALSLFERCKRLLRRSAGLSVERAQQVEFWKKALMEEHGELSKELNELLEVYERSLTCFAEHAAQLDEIAFQRERRSLEEIRQILANAIRRLELSTKDNQELINEWNEWRARRSFVEETPLVEIQRVRMEMLRSELAVRGLKQQEKETPLPSRRDPSPVLREEEAQVPVPQTRPTQSSVPSRSTRDLDHLDDWHEISTQRIEPISVYWMERLQRLSDEHPPEAWPDMIRQFRAAQGALKRQDRQKGIHRDRLEIFTRTVADRDFSA